MKENTKEKMLKVVNKNNILYKIKKFLRRIFKTGKSDDKEYINREEIIEKKESKKTFNEYVKKIEDEETKLLKLQKQFRAGEIDEGDLTEEEIKSLKKLYKKQIEELKKENLIRREKIMKYRKNSI